MTEKSKVDRLWLRIMWKKDSKVPLICAQGREGFFSVLNKIRSISKVTSTPKQAILDIENYTEFPENWSKAVHYALNNLPIVVQEIENMGKTIHRNMVMRNVISSTNNGIKKLAPLSKRVLGRQWNDASITDTIINNKLPIQKHWHKHFKIENCTAIPNFITSKNKDFNKLLGELKKILNEKQKPNGSLPDKKIAVARFSILLFEELKIRYAKIKLSNNNTIVPDDYISSVMFEKEAKNHEWSSFIIKDNVLNDHNANAKPSDWYHLHLILSKLYNKLPTEEFLEFNELMNHIAWFRTKERDSAGIKPISRGTLMVEPAKDTFWVLLSIDEHELLHKAKSILNFLIRNGKVVKISNKNLLQVRDEEYDTIVQLGQNIKDWITWDDLNSIINDYLIYTENTSVFSSFLKLLQQRLTENDAKSQHEIFTKLCKEFGISEDKHNTTSNKILPFCNITIEIDGTPLEIQIKSPRSKNLKKFLEDNKALYTTVNKSPRETTKASQERSNKMKEYFDEIAKSVSSERDFLKKKRDGHIEEYNEDHKRYFDRKLEELLEKYKVYRTIVGVVEDAEAYYKDIKDKEAILEQYPKDQENTDAYKILRQQVKRLNKRKAKVKKWRSRLENNTIEFYQIKEGKEKEFFSKMIFNLSDLDHPIYKFKNTLAKDLDIILRKCTTDTQRKEQLKLYLARNIWNIVDTIIRQMFHIGNKELMSRKVGNNKEEWIIPQLLMSKEDKIKNITKVVITLLIKDRFFQDATYTGKITKLEEDEKEKYKATHNREMPRNRRWYLHSEEIKGIEQLQDIAKDVRAFLERDL